ncbi:hypothetical protein GGR58DRAFT_463567 [Xylaria digitata]|nr:hypothetical protein GGR58DRAFT_463567 [Xylaria digitata]
MSTPLPLPSKAAIRALRSIALGTSCAIGVIVEDRRRRISTLKTAVANKQKLKSSRQYHHGSLEQLSYSLDSDTVVGPSLQWHEKEDRELRMHRHIETTEPEITVLEGNEGRDLSQDENLSKHAQIPESLSQSLGPQPTFTQRDRLVAMRRIQPSLASQSLSISPVGRVTKDPQPSPPAVLGQCQNILILSIENLLAGHEDDRMDRAVSLFLSNSSRIPSSPLFDRWLNLSVRLTKLCRAHGRWEDASRIFTTMIGFGTLDEAQYFAYNPVSIIEFHLRRPNPSTRCSKESVKLAADLFLAKPKKNDEGRGFRMHGASKLLILEALALQRFDLALQVYWKMLGWVKHPVPFIRWAIGAFFQHGDYKSVMKIFFLHYRHLESSTEGFNTAIDYVIGSIEAMKGLNADAMLEALAQINYPTRKRPRARWIMKLLRAHWTRHRDISKTKDFFDKAVSLGLMDRIYYPQGIYRSLVEIAVNAGDEETARLYADKVIHDHPDMKDDIALKLAVLKANAGDWQEVVAIFKQVQRNELAEPTAYDNTFILVLGAFAKSHTAAETQEFAMLFVRDMGVGFHRYMVTLIAKKYGEDREMKSFMAWLELCSQEGFALDAGFCNSVLYNCWAKWKVSFLELRAMYAKFKALNPQFADEVTHRIMSQAAHRAGNGLVNVRSGKIITVNKMAYSGRTTNKRDIFEAMSQELMKGRRIAAVAIYKRAINHGMPFCGHCLRLAVLAALRVNSSGPSYALPMIQHAHAQGHDVASAVSAFIRHQIDTFVGNAESVIIHMRNVISRFESSQIVIDPAVLTHMAAVCVKIDQHEKAIALCHLARDRSGSPHVYFSLQSCKVLASAYSLLLNIEGMLSLIDHVSKGEFSADKALLSHLVSVRRLVVRRIDESNARTVLLEVIERGIQQLKQARAKTRKQGKLISKEALLIVGNALADLERNKETEPVVSTEGPKQRLTALG